MYSSVNITSDGTFRIHTYTAPDDGLGRKQSHHRARDADDCH